MVWSMSFPGVPTTTTGCLHLRGVTHREMDQIPPPGTEGSSLVVHCYAMQLFGRSGAIFWAARSKVVKDQFRAHVSIP